jgi:hypothetical protein
LISFSFIRSTGVTDLNAEKTFFPYTEITLFFRQIFHPLQSAARGDRIN